MQKLLPGTSHRCNAIASPSSCPFSKKYATGFVLQSNANIKWGPSDEQEVTVGDVLLVAFDICILVRINCGKGFRVAC